MSDKIMVAMSGGVDSSVAVSLLKEQGFDCYGVMMQMFDSSLPEFQGCSALGSVQDAKDVAERLAIPFELIDGTDVFRSCVIDAFVHTYELGGTPNPCVDCNRTVKFGKLLQIAEERGMTGIATGHYARVQLNETTGRYELLRALDRAKDQSYMLYSLSQKQLSRCHFPLGPMTKAEARAKAEELGLCNADKKDSQDICFIPDGDYGNFLERYTGHGYEPGKFVTRDGKVLGEHKGIVHYTIGQRKGLGISAEAPLYVTDINPVDNTVTLSFGEGLFSNVVYVEDANWISVEKPEPAMRVQAKIRYRHEAEPATVYPEGENGFRVVFDRPQRAVTKGQACVLYDGDVVVGGGTIVRGITEGEKPGSTEA